MAKSSYLPVPMICSPPLLHLKPPGNPNRILNSLFCCSQSVTTFPGSGIAPVRNFAVSTRVHSLVRQISSYDFTFNDEDFNVEVGRLLYILPEEMRRRVAEHPELQFLIEVVMDLGRKPLARFPSGDFVLSNQLITAEDIKRVNSQCPEVRTWRDLVKEGVSLLLIGPPGVGKTTIIRDVALMLSNEYKKRVMIVDTSNEIGGDGDIPHAGIGNACRLQVPHSDVQHKNGTLGFKLLLELEAFPLISVRRWESKGRHPH